MEEQTNKSMRSGTKIAIALVVVAVLVGGYFMLNFYKTYFSPNFTAKEKYLYIKTGSDINALFTELENKEMVKDAASFKKAAGKMELAKSLKAGRYLVKKGMTNRVAINMIKAGNQEPIKLKINNLRTKENFAAFLGKNLEADSMQFINMLTSSDLITKYGFNQDNVYTMFIPNTYNVYWNVAPEDFFKRMNKEYDSFWTTDRKKKAEALDLTPIKATILASIVDGEALYDKEMPIIAGLYLNRMKKGQLLQADPTVIFANGDFSVKRVTGSLLQTPSLYNTYKYAGLPPGPIMMPSISAIDAVLNRDENDYIYMCAKDDFSGYHNFASTLEEHNVNARKYREALNKRKIFR